MKHFRFFPFWMCSLCLAAGHLTTGCGGDEEVVIIDFCAQALFDMNAQGCRERAYSVVEDLQVCVRDECDIENAECVDACLDDPETALTGCYGEIGYLVSGVCDDCYTLCYFDFLGNEQTPGCLFTETTGTQCLDDLYDCMNDC